MDRLRYFLGRRNFVVIVIGGDVVGVKRGHSLVKRRSAVAMYIHAASSHEIVTVRVKGSFSFFFI